MLSLNTKVKFEVTIYIAESFYNWNESIETNWK